MADFGTLFDVITDPWFESEPARIVWFTKLLRAADADGVVKMSRAQYGKLFNTTADKAHYFLVLLERKNLVLRKVCAKCTQITICKLDSYVGSVRKVYANNTQTEEVLRNLYAICTQITPLKSECYDTFVRKVSANNTQSEGEIYREEERKDKRKEKVLPPIPPIIKEKIKEKKEEEHTLALSYAPDFVGDVSHADAKELAKQKRAEARKAKTVERKEKEKTLVHKARLIFEAFYQEAYTESYYWSAKDAVAMNRLLKKITFGRTNRTKPLPCDDDSLLSAFKTFLSLINKAWLLKNFSVTKIDSQYNEIVSEIKNQNTANNGNRNQTTPTAATILANQAAGLCNDIAKADELYYRGEQGGDGA